eukprot:TRINITY_DN10695_c0_g1_i1.p1 TRINITY_DN10695_c0_g1~~TRINITY_DN10695_c0_g1_i1.p1  ORF type:complete len:413 (+),score=39.07 TRINITY_DN10695_c0_g1_i1:62-1300(+)
MASNQTASLCPSACDALPTAGAAAFKYLYPLVLMSLTRRHCLEEYVAAGAFGNGENQLCHMRSPPDASFRFALKPNVDTLYTLAWMDLSAEPLVLRIPVVNNRDYVMQLLDAWTNTFASPGSRTTGTASEGHFAICGPNYNRSLPSGVQRIDSSTNIVWMIGRVQLRGREEGDLEKVHAVQDGFALMPLSRWIRDGDSAKNPAVPDHPFSRKQTSPLTVVNGWNAQEYFEYAAGLLSDSPPARADRAMVHMLHGLGIDRSSGRLDWNKLSLYQRSVLRLGKSLGMASISAALLRVQTKENSWTGLDSSIGDYGTDYDTRAVVVAMGLGANKPADATYRLHSWKGGYRYQMRFEAGQLLPTNAFWSKTAYDKEGHMIQNKLNRCNRGRSTRGCRSLPSTRPSIWTPITLENLF